VNNELKLIKEVNTNFRSENNRVMGSYSSMTKQIEDLKSELFKLNENHIKLKKDLQRTNKELI
jgi:hypothetical protein